MYRETYVDGHVVEFFISIMDCFEVFYGHRTVRMLHRSENGVMTFLSNCSSLALRTHHTIQPLTQLARR